MQGVGIACAFQALMRGACRIEVGQCNPANSLLNRLQQQTLSRQGLLLQPVEQAVCRIALTHLDAARAAHERLKGASDTDALHDFRVALRRLRSVLRAYRPWLKNIPRKLR